MQRLLKTLALPILCIAFNANAAHQLISKEVKTTASSSTEAVKISQDAVDYLFQQSKEIIYRHKTGVTPLNMSVLSEAGNVVPTEDDFIVLDFGDNKRYPLDLDLEFDGISIKGLAIEDITYKDAEFLENIHIQYLSLMGERGERVFINNDQEGITVVFDHKGYNYQLSGNSKLNVKKRKNLEGKNDGIVNPQQLNTVTSQIETSHSQTIAPLATWPNKSVPTGTVPSELSWGISVLYLVHPSIWERSYEGRIISKFTTPGKSVANKVFKEERIIDGESGNDFLFYTANYKSKVTGKHIYAYITAPPSLCPGDYCTSNYVDLLGRMNTNSDVIALRNEWKADIVILLHNVPDYRYNQAEGMANIPSSPTDTSFKNYANAIVYYDEYESDAYLHESFHLLGGRHSQYEPKSPGVGSAKAYIGSYKDYSQSPTESVGFRSLMSYNDICTSVTEDSSCQWFKRLSSPTTQVTLYPQNKVYTLGTSLNNNKARVISLVRTVSNFSKN